MFSGVKAVEQLYIRSSENIGSQSLFKRGFVSSVVEVSITVNYSQLKSKSLARVVQLIIIVIIELWTYGLDKLVEY